MHGVVGQMSRCLVSVLGSLGRRGAVNGGFCAKIERWLSARTHGGLEAEGNLGAKGGFKVFRDGGCWSDRRQHGGHRMAVFGVRQRHTGIQGRSGSRGPLRLVLSGTVGINEVAAYRETCSESGSWRSWTKQKGRQEVAISAFNSACKAGCDYRQKQEVCMLDYG